MKDHEKQANIDLESHVVRRIYGDNGCEYGVWNVSKPGTFFIDVVVMSIRDKNSITANGYDLNLIVNGINGIRHLSLSNVNYITDKCVCHNVYCVINRNEKLSIHVARMKEACSKICDYIELEDC